MATKGLVALITLNIGLDRGLITQQFYGVGFLTVLIVTSISTPIASYIVDFKELSEREARIRLEQGFQSSAPAVAPEITLTRNNTANSYSDGDNGEILIVQKQSTPNESAVVTDTTLGTILELHGKEAARTRIVSSYV